MVSGVGPQATLKKFNIPVLANLQGVGANMEVCWLDLLLLIQVQISDFLTGSYVRLHCLQSQLGHGIPDS